MGKKKSLKTFDKFEICKVLEKCGVINDNQVVHNVMYQFDNITNIFENLREGNQMRLNDDVQMVLDIMEGRWGYKFDKPSLFKVIKTDDGEGNRYVKVEWV